jgi:hypothetical protein
VVGTNFKASRNPQRQLKPSEHLDADFVRFVFTLSEQRKESDMSDKSTQIKEFFLAPEPKFPTISVVVGGVAIFIGLAIGSGAAAAGILIGLAVIGLGVLFYNKAKQRYEARPTDQQMDAWLREDFQHIGDRDALESLGLDETQLERKSLRIAGPIYWQVDGVSPDEVLRKVGKDGSYRYSVWRVEIFAFTKNYLADYGCVYNWLRNTSVNEHTNEFFYKDVVSVKTASESTAYTLKDGQRMEHSQTFQLKLSGDQVQVVTNNGQLKTSAAMTSDVDAAVQSIRTMLREKKA